MTGREPPSSPVQAYDRAANAWAEGADPAYQRFAEALLRLAPATWSGAVVADIAAGSGAVSSALRSRGAQPVALDGAPSMLTNARRRVLGLVVVAGDAGALPLATGALEGAAMGFCLNHVAEPWLLLAEAARVVRPRGTVLASTFARGADHPAKVAVDAAARDHGWRPSTWYTQFLDHARHSDTPDLLAACAVRAGLDAVSVSAVDVDTGVRDPAGLVAWRLGMPELAVFVAGLGADEQAALARTAAENVGDDPPPLVRRVLLLSAVNPSAVNPSAVNL